MRQNPLPIGWTREQVASDLSWIERLTPEEIRGFDYALDAARTLNKDFLSMQPEDFPLPDASMAVLKRALKKTQGPWRFCLLKGLPVEDFADEDKKRYLIRLWLAIPGCQPLSDEWTEPYKSTLRNAVRGGLRGPSMSDAFVTFKKRQAVHHDMNNHLYDRQPH